MKKNFKQFYQRITEYNKSLSRPRQIVYLSLLVLAALGMGIGVTNQPETTPACTWDDVNASQQEYLSLEPGYNQELGMCVVPEPEDLNQTINESSDATDPGGNQTNVTQ